MFPVLPPPKSWKIWKLPTMKLGTRQIWVDIKLGQHLVVTEAIRVNVEFYFPQTQRFSWTKQDMGREALILRGQSVSRRLLLHSAVRHWCGISPCKDLTDGIHKRESPPYWKGTPPGFDKSSLVSQPNVRARLHTRLVFYHIFRHWKESIVYICIEDFIWDHVWKLDLYVVVTREVTMTLFIKWCLLL